MVIFKDTDIFVKNVLSIITDDDVDDDDVDDDDDIDNDVEDDVDFVDVSVDVDDNDGHTSGDEEGEDGDKKKRQTRGGRGVIKAKKKAVVEKRVTLSRASRGKKKFVTCIQGLGTYGEFDIISIWITRHGRHEMAGSLKVSCLDNSG